MIILLSCLQIGLGAIIACQGLCMLIKEYLKGF